MKALKNEKPANFEDDTEMFFSSSDDEILSYLGEPVGAGALEDNLL